jgi:flagellar hook assembly protein FlgD
MSIKILKGTQEIRGIYNLPGKAGLNTTYWDGKDNQGKPVPRGTYTLKVYGKSNLAGSNKSIVATKIFLVK